MQSLYVFATRYLRDVQSYYIKAKIKCLVPFILEKNISKGIIKWFFPVPLMETINWHSFLNINTHSASSLDIDKDLYIKMLIMAMITEGRNKAPH